MDSAVVLEAQHLYQQVSERVILQDISLRVARGEILAILGPSGSGKSSLLRLLNRLDEPSSGAVLLDGVDYKTMPPRALRQKVGLVLQAPHLFPGTVEDNLQFGPRQRGYTLAVGDIAELLDSVGLRDFATRDISRLSGGEAQRVNLARALAVEPEVLLLDEPCSALDADMKGAIERLIARLVKERNLAGVLVTHDAAQARRLAARAMLIEAGRVVSVGPAEEVAGA